MSVSSHRILVTGASGFIGRALVPALAAQGHRVKAAARGVQSGLANVETVALPDIAKPVEWVPLVRDMEVVVHLAGVAHRKTVEDADADRANRDATADLAATCKTVGIGRLIFMSSIGAQTGSAADHVLTENDPLRPVTAYDRAKLAAEDAVRKAGVDHSILRPVIVYGAEPKANVARLAKLAALPIPLPLGAFRNRRSLLAIDNLIAAVIACLDGEATRNQTFVVSDPAALTLAEILSVMRRAMGRSPMLFSIPPSLLRMLLKAGGRPLIWDRIGRDLIVDPQKLRDAGWRPPVTTEQGLTAMMRAMNARPSG